MKHIKTALGILAIVLVLAGAAVFGIWRVNPPIADETSPTFQRMMYNLERLATGERWVGTPELEIVRAEIIAEIEAMGLTPVIHRSVLTTADRHEASTLIGQLRGSWTPPPYSEDWAQMVRNWVADRHPDHPLVHQGYMYVDNIWVTLESPNTNSGSIMFVAHYDSWPNTPGTADAMLPVTAMLETLRAHAGNDNLASNLHFLFTDGEEWGALGALAFSRDFPEVIDEIDLLINLEAQGNSGGLIAFEFSEAPYDMVRLFNRAAPRPIGFHWADWVYATFLPGSFTDFTIFREYGFRGLNFAIVGGGEYYHTPYDNFENLNRNTAWHYLVTVMALADYAAVNDLAVLRQPSHEAIFFTFLPGNMLVMTVTMANILTGLAFAAAIGFLVYKFMTKLPNSRPVTILVALLAITTALVIIFASHLSYLLWLPLLAVSASAFLKGRGIAYRCAMTATGAIALLLWVPPVYLLLLLFQII